MQEKSRHAEKPQGSAHDQRPEQMRPEQSLAGYQGKPEQGIEKQQAEGQIHEPGTPRHRPPDAPEYIIGNGQQEAQTHGQQEDPALLGNRQLHQPKSLASRPAPLGLSSS